MTNELGGTLGQIIRPIQRVGLYVPGGTAPLPSTVLMSAIPARGGGRKGYRGCHAAKPLLEKYKLACAAHHSRPLLPSPKVDEIYLLGGAQASLYFSRSGLAA